MKNIRAVGDRKLRRRFSMLFLPVLYFFIYTGAIQFEISSTVFVLIVLGAIIFISPNRKDAISFLLGVNSIFAIFFIAVVGNNPFYLFGTKGLVNVYEENVASTVAALSTAESINTILAFSGVEVLLILLLIIYNMILPKKK